MDNDAETAPRSSGIATASLVLGIASILIGLFIVLGWVIGLLAAILGATATRQPISNERTARVGIVLGLIGVALTLIVTALRAAG